MFVLDPINSITSINFYGKVSGQSGRRTALYLFYIALLFSLVAAAAVKTRVGPVINDTFDWLEKSVPELEFSAGKLTSTSPMPLTIRHPQYNDLAVTIDTNRVDPVTPQMLEDAKIVAYVASNAVYLMQNKNELRVIDLSKSKEERPVKIDANFFESSRAALGRALYPVTFVLTFFIFLVWKSISSLFYSAVGLTINSSASTNLSFGSLFKIAVYAQTLVILLQAIFLFMPIGMPAPTLVSLIVTSIYIWLAVKRIRAQDEPAASAA